jgi:hypothetical protein
MSSGAVKEKPSYCYEGGFKMKRCYGVVRIRNE